ncbi:MAG: DUF92 domain-containing protein [Candidatus Marinimicrobia bacterium]|nr:DUF92 domain-containing protein [Candidatus Neomarinimicrobiota bacterium]
MDFPRYIPFSNEWISFGLFFLLILTLIGISELIKSKYKWPVERSRKLVHVVVGILISICPFIFTSPQPPVTLAVIFIIINTTALKSKHFKAMHATERKTYGTIYFPLAFLILSLFWWSRPVSLIIGTLLMTFADTAASTVGNMVKNPRRYRLWADNKTIEGSVAMFITSFVLVALITICLRPFIPFNVTFSHIPGLAGFVALVAVVAESNSKNGSDNFSVPLLGSIAFDIYLTNHANGTILVFMFWVIFSLIMFLLAYRLQALSGSGGVGAFITGIVIFGSGGLKWITPLIVFFVLSSLISKIGNKKSKALKALTWANYQKSTRRDLLQVLANGGVATIVAVINFYNPIDWLYFMYLGAIAAATADTWATEIGFFSTNDPKHILSLKSVPKGTSGGVSLLGTLGTIIGAAIIGLSGLIFGLDWHYVILITLAGFIGSLVDSLLGGSVQSRFRCQSCGTITENHTHCDKPTRHFAGIQWIDNDMVNLLCTLSGALIVINL